mmetsp:Transcript_28431/g.80030  ORF Transcript_28431/g.80030 Transcript_28431/m.80030 type:complete len:305 (+) Transcript_28431:1003-1917(+)
MEHLANDGLGLVTDLLPVGVWEGNVSFHEHRRKAAKEDVDGHPHGVNVHGRTVRTLMDFRSDVRCISRRCHERRWRRGLSVGIALVDVADSLGRRGGGRGGSGGGLAEVLGHAKIGQLDLDVGFVVIDQQDVLRLDVPVDDVVLVQALEGAQHLVGDSGRLGFREPRPVEGSSRLILVPDGSKELPAATVLGDEMDLLIRLVHIMQRDDVRVVLHAPEDLPFVHVPRCWREEQGIGIVRGCVRGGGAVAIGPGGGGHNGGTTQPPRPQGFVLGNTFDRDGLAICSSDAQADGRKRAMAQDARRR